ncbi:uncharacterized protein C8Q71DRAFT_855619 [Rhodofomes roseus]|uniref:Uncharacterized protein n=1 Tax=Rhodofomes roseus TaxID=34475 RepID=A0ABQ8KPH5_9APHY|nr:uncharacterized protein C8Q71DRAFT_855619 [Rhodofomes roseus]KAH9840334.1 hypothetical protein C8Q71DRAFT_855619 [Rhodofomes roseus]
MSLQIVPWEPEQLPTLQRSESVDADINTGNVPPSRPVLPSKMLNRSLKKKCATFTKKMWRENGVRVCFLVAANTTDIGPVVSLVDHNAIIGAPSNFSDVTRDPKWNSTNLWSDWERFATDLLGEKPRSVLDARVAQQRADFGRLFATDEATGLPIIPPRLKSSKSLKRGRRKSGRRWFNQFLVEHHITKRRRAFRMSGWLASDAKHGMQPPMYDEWATRDAQRREAERQAERQVAEEQAAADQAAEEQAAAEQGGRRTGSREQAPRGSRPKNRRPNRRPKNRRPRDRRPKNRRPKNRRRQAAEKQAVEGLPAENRRRPERGLVSEDRQADRQADEGEAAERQAVEGLPAERQAAARQTAVRTWIVQQRQAAERQAAEGQAEVVSAAYGSSAYGRLMADRPLEQPTPPCPLELSIARFPFVSGDAALPPSSPPRPRGAPPPGFSWHSFPSTPPVQLPRAAAESVSSSSSGSSTVRSGNEVRHSGKKRLLLDDAPATSPPRHFKRPRSGRAVEEQCSNTVS